MRLSDVYGDDVVSVRKFCALSNLQRGRFSEGEADTAARLGVAQLLPRCCKVSGIREFRTDREYQSLFARYRAHQLATNQDRAEHDDGPGRQPPQ